MTTHNDLLREALPYLIDSAPAELYDRIDAALAAPTVAEPVAIVERNDSGQIRIVWENGKSIADHVGAHFYTQSTNRDKP